MYLEMITHAEVYRVQMEEQGNRLGLLDKDQNRKDRHQDKYQMMIR